MPADTSSRRSTKSRQSSAGNPRLEFKDEPNSPIAAAPSRTKRAQDYEEKVNDLLRTIMNACAQSPGTVPDAAALIAHGPTLASKTGDLADSDPRVRRAVDFITSGTDNPYLAFSIAALPLIAQILRNHETGEEKRRVTLRIPFTKRLFTVPFRIRLKNPVLRSVTVDPKLLADSTFTQPDILAAMLSQGVQVPGYSLNGSEPA